MLKYNFLLLWIVLLVADLRLYGQNYSVTGTVQVKAPYSVFLSDYTKIEEDKLIVNLRLNDPAIPVNDVRLKIKVESQTVTLETSSSFIPAPLTLNSGFMERFTGADLSEYFLANNLQFTRGLTKQEFQRRGAIPEGLYKICIEVYDYISGNKISLPICTQAWIVLNDPPRLLLPENNSIVKANDPQNLPFRWMAMNGGSPNSFFTTEYEFSLYEVWPATRNPNDAVNTTPPIFQETTNTPVYFYSIAEPFLVPGRRYAWRVKARDAGGLDMFKNQGYSEVFSFVWGVECNTPLGVSTEVLSSDRTKATWDERDNATGYVVRYRERVSTGERGNTGMWYEVKTSSVSAFMTGTKAETEYEYQVRCECSGIAGQYSSLNYFTTPKAGNYQEKLNCNDQSKPPVITNKNPLVKANKGDEFKVGLFTVTITEVSGGNGIFTGRGRVNIALINAEIVADFKNIKVNTDRQVYEGQMVVRSVGASLVPPEIRDQIKDKIVEIDKYLNDLEKFAPKADDALKISKEVLGKVDDMIKDIGDALKRDSIEGKNPSGGWHISLQLGNFRDKIKDGFDWLSKGDSTNGKNLIAEAMAGIKDLVGNAGEGLGDLGNAIVNGAENLDDLIKKILQDLTGQNKDTVIAKSKDYKTLKERRRSSAKKINEKSSGYEVGKNSHYDMEHLDVQRSPKKKTLTSKDRLTLSNNSSFKDFFESAEKMRQAEQIALKSIVIASVCMDILKDPDSLKKLISETWKELKSDLKSLQPSVIQKVKEGKDPELEEKIKNIVRSKIENLASDYIK